MAAGEVDLGGCVSYGVEALKRNPLYQIVGVLLVNMVGSATMGILTGPMLVGYMNGMQKEDAGGKAELGDLFTGFKEPKLVPALVGGVIIVLAMSLLGLLIIPLFILAPMLMVTILRVRKGTHDGIEAIKQSWEAVQPPLVMAAVTTLVLGIIGGLGVILCGIGALITGPIATAGMYKMALQIDGEADAAELEAPAEAPAEAEEAEETPPAE